MDTQRYIGALAIVLFTGCLGTGKVADDTPRDAGHIEAPAPVVTATADGKLPVVTPIRLPSTPVTKNYNITFTTVDPTTSAASAKAALIEAGAEVTNFSAGPPDYSSLNVRGDQGKCEGLLGTLRELGYPVLNESVSENDLRSSVRQHQVRLRNLALADREITKWMRGVADSDAMDGLLILRELSRNEQRNQENQLLRYATQAEHCQLSVSFQKTQPSG